MLNSSKIMFISMMIISIIMMISSENWMSMWISLEINMLSFIPMMKSKKNKSSEAMMSYFLIQATSSIIFITTILINPMINVNYENIMFKIIMIMSISMKMGVAPMNMWIVQIMEKLSWNPCMLMLTMQKINPMWIISIMKSQTIMIIMSVISCMIGSIGGLNQTSVKKIMTFSSVNHLGWMIFSMKNSNETWMKYMIIYIMMSWMIMNNLMKNSITQMNQISMNYKSKTEKINMIIMMMSIGGMPPTVGFLNKWMIIQENSSDSIIMMIIIMTSIINLFFYLRMVSPMLMMQSYMNKWNFKFKNIKTENMINMNMLTPILIMLMI